MLGACILGCSMVLGGAQAAEVLRPQRPWGGGGLHASITTPSGDDATLGYDLGLSHRGRRLSLDLDLARAIYSGGRETIAPDGFMRIDARRTVQFAGGLLGSAGDGGFHHLELELDRMTWLDLAQSRDSLAYAHQVARTMGVSGRYGRGTGPDRSVRGAVYLGAGVRKSLTLDSSHDGTWFERNPIVAVESGAPSSSEELMEMDGSTPRSHAPTIDLGNHRAELKAGVSLSAQARVAMALWPGVVDGRLDGMIELDQLDVSTVAVDRGLQSAREHWTTVTSSTRLAADFVVWKDAVVPCVFVDLNTMAVLESPSALGVVPVYGVGLTRGGG